MADPMKIRANTANGVTEVKVLMAHPMETGVRKDASGNVVPAHYITDVTVKHGDRVVLQCMWGQSVSQNPYLAFKFKGGAKGEKVSVSWQDNKGDSRTDEATIA
ncbi:thiosulfate oxidation carrier complex protein SoxZ [Pseudoduganella sp. OTU4001]|uniref:thiosulfate oxidation carrier complex protein SoxZ n=1 Tax=Pseudoduganella sp. OTU4001 TaxID=3043854 RepID=UPI00313BE7F8